MAGQTSGAASSRRPPPQRRPTQAQRREDALQRLFDAAFRLIADGGIKSLSLAGVAQLAGCSRELPRYHFGSKDAFIEALLDDCGRIFDEHLQRPHDEGLRGADALFALFDSLNGFFAEPRTNRGRLRLINELTGSGSPRLRRKVNAVHTALREHLLKSLEDGIASGHLAPIEDPAAFTMLLHSTYRGIGFQWVMDPASLDLPAVLRELRQTYTHRLSPLDS